MKQLLQDLNSGETILVEAPAPVPKGKYLLLHTTVSLVSLGTERMLVDFGRASYLAKARQQPEKVKQVLEKIKTDGLFATIGAVRSKLAQPLPLGYCNVGTVNSIGKNAVGFKLGDRVVSNGPHAEVVNVPQNLCALVPEEVSDEEAAFTVVASIGLQGIRLAELTLGERVVVIGAGLIGLLTIQMLRAHGCQVLAVDFEQSKLDLAKQFGAEICNPKQGDEVVAAGMAFSQGQGVDAVLITATTNSNDPITQAAKMSRKRGRIILVGVAGLELNRSDFYEKELTFQVSCSYGPGRYDPDYEEQGQDYPLGFVRWTEQRNFAAVLAMMAEGKLKVKPLITHRVLFTDAPQIYQSLAADKSALGVLLQYRSDSATRSVKQIRLHHDLSFDLAKPVIGFIGAGNYASRILLPAFKRAGGQLHTLVTASGVSGAICGKKNGFLEASTDLDAMLADPEINAVVIATRHNTHAELVIKALRARKHLFVEKPLAIKINELDEIEQLYKNIEAEGKRLHLMVGFNRRFAPQILKMKQLLRTVRDPKSFIMTVNAGAIPAKHWTQDHNLGGGRIIGEACHFIDLMRFLAGSAINNIQCCYMGKNSATTLTEDKATITLSFADGSFGSIHYLANGAPSFPKERIEVFAAGKVLQLDNFCKLKGFGWPSFKRMNLWQQNKGQNECVAWFLEALEQGKETPIPLAEIFEVARFTIKAAELFSM